MRLLWRYFLNTGRIYDKRPGLIFSFVLFLLKGFHILNYLAPSFDVEHYLESNRQNCDDQILTMLSGVELLIVAAPKDFILLEDCISNAISSQAHITWSKVSIVVPFGSESDAKSYCESISVPIEVISESNFISNSEYKILNEKFKDRTGWVIQQLIKLRYLSTSGARAVLVIDCDTILLKSRNWMNREGMQALFVSEEYNQNYHAFLDYLSFNPQYKYTFISHHMFYQPTLFKNMLENLHLYNSDDQVQKILNFPLNDAVSPFSLDYELYGQWVLQNNLGVLKKWSNVEIDRKSYLSSKNRKQITESLELKWASVSLHSWRQRA